MLWGKKAEYAAGKEGWLRAAAELAPLHSTLPPLAALPQLSSHGHLGSAQWEELLAGSSFFLGLGDPLLGPSAADALGGGSVFINPSFAGSGVRAELAVWGSQHPYLAEQLGEPYVCSAALGDEAQLAACIRKALAADLPPLLPPQLTVQSHEARVASIFQRWWRAGSAARGS